MGVCGGVETPEYRPCCDQGCDLSSADFRPQAASGGAVPPKGRAPPVGLHGNPAFRLVALGDDRQPLGLSPLIGPLAAERDKLAHLRITVLEVKNSRPESMFRVNNGSHRREDMLQVGSQLVIPSLVGRHGKMQLSLFQRVASELLPTGGASDATCKIAVKQTDGHVHLRIRHDYAACDAQQRVRSLFDDALVEQTDDPLGRILEQLKEMQLSANDAGRHSALASSPICVALPEDSADCIAAGMLDVVTYTLNKPPEEVLAETFKVVLQKGERKLGLDINHYDMMTLLVTKVHAGPVSEHNSRLFDMAIEPGDRILEINGTQHNVEEMLGRVRRDSELRMTVRRHPESFVEISRAGDAWKSPAGTGVGIDAEICDCMSLVINSVEEGLVVRSRYGSLGDLKESDRIMAINNVRGDALRLQEELARVSLPMTIAIRRVVKR